MIDISASDGNNLWKLLCAFPLYTCIMPEIDINSWHKITWNVSTVETTTESAINVRDFFVSKLTYGTTNPLFATSTICTQYYIVIAKRYQSNWNKR